MAVGTTLKYVPKMRRGVCLQIPNLGGRITSVKVVQILRIMTLDRK
jgi:hypothetical protein